jgi:hypothetical protein
VAELEALSGVNVTDLHKHFVDKVIIHKDGKTYRRTPEVLDCWFESGAMPYAQQHYPFGGEGSGFFLMGSRFRSRESGVQTSPSFSLRTSSLKASTRRAAGSTR